MAEVTGIALGMIETRGLVPAIEAARAAPCQPGSMSSQIPVGRSKRPSFSQGRMRSGA